MRKYSVDTSVLLDGWRRYYPPDVFPALWSKLDTLIESGALRASEEVLFELARKDDDVHAWAKERPHFFVPIDEGVQVAVTEILGSHPTLIDARANRSGADPFVIAYAKVDGRAVLTGERPTNSIDRPHIPDVCSAMGIESTSLLELIREQGWTFR